MYNATLSLTTHASLPHPSSASGERIAYFLGRKPKGLLSVKTNAARLDIARAGLVSKIGKLGGQI